MPERFHQFPFTDAARAQTNLALIEKRLPSKLWQALPTLLSQVPDPGGALNYLERYVRDDGRDALDRTLRYVERNPAALHYLLLVFSYSRFLSETLVQQPELAEWLHRPTRTRIVSSREFASHRGGIERVKSDEDLEEEFARFEATSLDIEPSRILARFKRREYLRIMLRDVLGLATLADTTFELSQLADVLLRRALRIAEQHLEADYGAPQLTDAAGRAQRTSFILLSLGKLGAQELNYASDIDLIFLYDHDGNSTGGSHAGISNHEYFVRLAHAVLKLITEFTPEGALFRVDMRLRPQGAEGFVALSIPAALAYYRTRAREWELQALIKARPSAGNLEAGRAFLRELHALVFRPEFNLAAVEAVLNAREEMTRSLTRGRRGGFTPPLPPPASASLDTTEPSAEPSAASREHSRDASREHSRDTSREHSRDTWNVKLTPGGIRDIEFLAQCLQRLYGGADPWLASSAASSTLVALQRLHDKGHLSGHDFSRLGAAYQFLRLVEHRLQLRDGLQRHTLPGPDAAPLGALDRLARRCAIEAPPGRAGELLLDSIRRHFAEVREIYNRLILPHRKAESPAAPPSDSTLRPGGLLRRIAQNFPAAARAARTTFATGDAFARRGLDRFLTAALLDPAAMHELEMHPDRLERAAALFARSDFAAEILARHAGDIDLLDAQAEKALPSREDPQRASPEAALAEIRTAYRRRSLAALIDSTLGMARPFETFATLTAAADWALASVLPFALPQPAPPAQFRDSPFAALALGRLATGEMDFASDADLVFIAADDLTPQQREPWRRVAEQFIHLVSSQTREGTLFPVDTRLRPQGSAGDIVVTAAALCSYLQSSALAWEGITWLKARPVAGNPALGVELVRRVRTALAARWSPHEAQRQMTEELAALRARMEREGTGIKARGEFKHLPGSFFDVDYVLSLLVFRNGLVAGQAAGLPAADVLSQIGALESAAALDPSAAQTLRHAAELFRSVDHAHRVVTGRPANRPPEPALARRLITLLEAWGILPAGAEPAALEQALQAARQQVRSLYQKLFAPAG